MTRGPGAWLALSMVGIAGCGSGAVPDGYRPPIATFRGTLGSGGGSSLSPDLRMAVVWTSGVTPDAFPHRVAQEVTWTRTAPATFEIAITERPPDEVLQDGPVVGHLLAYHDLDHDGHLAFATKTDTGFADQLVGFDPDLELDYNEIDGDGAITIRRFNTPPGEDPASMALTLYGSPAPKYTCHLLDWIPTFALEAGGHLFAHDLNVGPWRYEEVYGTFDCPGNVSPPDTTALVCSVDAYTAIQYAQPSEFVANTCGPVVRFCDVKHARNTPLPADWPCPCDPSKFTCVDGGIFGL